MSARPEDVLLREVRDGVVRTAVWSLPDVSAALRTAGLAIEQDWQPIETAPRDGTAVLCWPFNYSSLFEGKAEPEIVIGFFSENDWWCESNVSKTFDPTHWRPLPAPPEGQP
jgi:hypothetical protein